MASPRGCLMAILDFVCPKQTSAPDPQPASPTSVCNIPIHQVGQPKPWESPWTTFFAHFSYPVHLLDGILPLTVMTPVQATVISHLHVTVLHTLPASLPTQLHTSLHTAVTVSCLKCQLTM